MPTTLKNNTTYDFSDEDLKFVLELAKVGHVNLLSRQVSLRSDEYLSFKEYGDNGTDGLKLPDNWVIEGIGVRNAKEGSKHEISITFGVSKK